MIMATQKATITLTGAQREHILQALDREHTRIAREARDIMNSGGEMNELSHLHELNSSAIRAIGG